AVGKPDIDIPAKRIEAFREPRPHAHHLAAEPARGVHEMTGMSEDKVAAFVGLGIAVGPACGRAGLRNRLEVVRHLVAIDAVPIPRLERQELSDFLLDELPCERDARIEAPVVANLESKFRGMNLPAQFLALLDGHAERLL